MRLDESGLTQVAEGGCVRRYQGRLNRHSGNHGANRSRDGSHGGFQRGSRGGVRRDFPCDSAAGWQRDIRAFSEGDLRADPCGDCQSDFPADSHRDSKTDSRRDLRRDLQGDFRRDTESVLRAEDEGTPKRNSPQRGSGLRASAQSAVDPLRVRTSDLILRRDPSIGRAQCTPSASLRAGSGTSGWNGAESRRSVPFCAGSPRAGHAFASL